MKKLKKINVLEIFILSLLIFVMTFERHGHIFDSATVYYISLSFIVAYFSIFINHIKTRKYLVFIPLFVFIILDILIEVNYRLSIQSLLPDLSFKIYNLYYLQSIILIYFAADFLLTKFFGKNISIGFATILFFLSLSIDFFGLFKILKPYNVFMKLWFIYTSFSNLNIKNYDRSKYTIGMIFSIFFFILEIMLAKHFLFSPIKYPLSIIFVIYFFMKLHAKDIEKRDYLTYSIFCVYYQNSILKKYLLLFFSGRFFILSFYSCLIAVAISVILYELSFFITDTLFVGIRKQNK